MKAPFVTAIFTGFFFFLLDETAAYSIPVVLSSRTLTTTHSTAHPSAETSISHDEDFLHMKVSGWQRIFRRSSKNRVQTLEREETDATTATPEKKKKDPLWRVMFYNSEYLPDRVAKVLAKIFPTLDRRAAFELCTRARSVGKVAVIITSKKQAEMYCLTMQRQGLTATIEPHHENNKD